MKKIFDRLEEYIGGTLFVGIFIILVLQVIFRQVLKSPLVWSEELSRLIFVWVAMLGISIGIRKQSHIYIDFLYNRFSPAVQKLVFTFSQIIIFASIICMGWFGKTLVAKKWMFKIKC